MIRWRHNLYLYTVPVHVDRAACAKREEAVENPVTGHLDAPHWKDKVILSEHGQGRRIGMLTAHGQRDRQAGRLLNQVVNDSWKVGILVRETICSCCSVAMTETLNERQLQRCEVIWRRGCP